MILCDSGRVSHEQHSHRPGAGAGAGADRRWLLAALAVVLAFMVAEVVAGLLAPSLALITDAGHMITDAAAIGVAVVAVRIARRPARGAYTYGFARVDALSGQANGITLVLLAIWFTVVGIASLGLVGFAATAPAARPEAPQPLSALFAALQDRRLLTCF